MSEPDSILLTEQRGRVRVLTLNRPQARNALSTALIETLRHELATADADGEVDVVILTGTDPAFCAGVDLRELGATGGPVQQVWDDDIPIGHPWRPLSKPVIGAINGAAITGGLELALACDFLLASDRARFADTHARVGVLPGWGLTARLPAMVGQGFARRMSLSGDFVGAQDALRAGLVTQVVEHEQLLSAALDVAATIVGNDQRGVRTLLDSYRRADAHLIDPALAVEADTSRKWMADFDPARVEERRGAIVDRGRSQNVAPD